MNNKVIVGLGLATVASLAAAQYQSDGIRMLSHIPLNGFSGSPGSGSAIYGWTSASGREYAVIGLQNGNAIVDITNPVAPSILNHIPGPNSSWHENVTMNGYSYAVTDGSGAIGIQIIDLNNADSGSAILAATYNGSSVGKTLSNVHTIQCETTTKRLFANGSNRGFVIFDASNPTSLVELGRWTTKYVHDSFIKNFTSGPYAGKQIAYLFCGTDGLYIVDTTNPANIITLGNTQYYPGAGNNTYCHSGSLTPDDKYMLLNDEFDENRSLVSTETTIIADVSNLSAPFRVGSFTNNLNTIDHNSNLRDGYLFLSSYKAGVRIYNAANPLGMSESGWFDSYPSSTDAAGYAGNWGVYAKFPSRNIILSDMQGGLFVLDPSESIGLGAPVTSVDWGTGVANNGTNLYDLRESDDKKVLVGPFSKGGFNFTLTYTSTVVNPGSIDLVVEGKATGYVDVFLKNVQTGQFDNVGRANFVNSGDQTKTISGLSSALYLSSSKQVVAKFGCEYMTKPFTPFEFDMLKCTVNKAPNRNIRHK